tara:strand:- start:471 stop:1409 length:939 start_codon:yes stop_codon:yes gene_type:complete
LIISTSCNHLNPEDSVLKELYFLQPPNGAVAEIDFSLSDSLLIKNIEYQTGINLCSNSLFSGKINVNGSNVIFPAFADKDCGFPVLYSNIIPIIINKKNQVLINETIGNENIKELIVKETELKKSWNKRKEIIYLVQWDTELESKIIKNSFLEILMGILEYYKIQSQKIFQKDIVNLNEQELIELKREYKGIIGFQDYTPPPPPPPSLENEKNGLETIPQGTFKYELYFAEFGGRMNNATCDVEINGNNIKVLQDGTTNFMGGDVIFEGLVIKHKSGVWILAHYKSDKDAEEVGGCTEIPVIYFENKLIEWC